MHLRSVLMGTVRRTRPAWIVFPIYLSIAGAFAAAPAWYARYDRPEPVPNSTQFNDFFSAEFNLGFSWVATSIRLGEGGTSVGMPTAVTFDGDGGLEWAYYLEIPTGVSASGRIVPSDDFERVFAGYTRTVSPGAFTQRQGVVGAFDGATLAKEYAYTFMFQELLNTTTGVAFYPGNIAGIVQSLEDSAHVMLIDESGEKILDQLYQFDLSQLPFPEPFANFDLRRLPDLSGFLLRIGPFLMRFDNDGTVVWAKQTGELLEYVMTPDGGLITWTMVPGQFFDPPTEDWVTIFQKIDADGERAWGVRIDDMDLRQDYQPARDANPVDDGENVWIIGGAFNESGSPPSAGRESLFLLRLDSATGELLAQTEIAVQGLTDLRGVFAGWTGQHAVVALNDGHLLKLDANLTSGEAVRLAAAVSEPHIVYDPDAGLFLFAPQAGQLANATTVIALDEALNPGVPCDVILDAILEITPGDRVFSSLGTPPAIPDATVTVSPANTELTEADLSIRPLVVNATDLCIDEPPVEEITYAIWAEEVFGADNANDPNIGGPDVDSTGDGVTNLHAYVLDLDPFAINARTSASVLSQDGPDAVLTFRRRANLADYTVLVEGSRDLENWNEPVVVVSVSVDAAGAETVRARLAEPISAFNRGFLGLRIVEN